MIEITNEMIRNPLSQYFIEPFVPDKSISKEYNAIVKIPMDLSTVKKRVSEKKYKAFNDWVNDMELIFNNAIAFNREQSLLGGVALYLKKVFGKRIESLRDTNSRTIESKIISCQNNITSLLSNPPNSSGVMSAKPLPKINNEKYNIKTLRKLMNDLNQICLEGSTDSVLSILNKHSHEKKYDSLSIVDLSLLGRNALNELEILVSKLK